MYRYAGIITLNMSIGTDRGTDALATTDNMLSHIKQRIDTFFYNFFQLLLDLYF